MTALHLPGHLFHRAPNDAAGSSPRFPWAWLALVLVAGTAAALTGYFLSRTPVPGDAPQPAARLTLTAAAVDPTALTMPDFLQQKRDARAEELPEQF